MASTSTPFRLKFIRGISIGVATVLFVWVATGLVEMSNHPETPPPPEIPTQGWKAAAVSARTIHEGDVSELVCSQDFPMKTWDGTRVAPCEATLGPSKACPSGDECAYGWVLAFELNDFDQVVGAKAKAWHNGAVIVNGEVVGRSTSVEGMGDHSVTGPAPIVTATFVYTNGEPDKEAIGDMHTLPGRTPSWHPPQLHVDVGDYLKPGLNRLEVRGTRDPPMEKVLPLRSVLFLLK